MSALDRRGVDEVDAGQYGSQPEPVQRHRGADERDQDARVDRVANQVVGPLVTSSGSSFCVIGVPSCARCDACRDREPQPEGEKDEPMPARHDSVLSPWLRNDPSEPGGS